MGFKLQAFIFAAALILLIGVHAEPSSEENTEVEQEEARACVDVYQECGRPGQRCCEDRPCKCSIAMTNCKCKKTLRELFG